MKKPLEQAPFTDHQMINMLIDAQCRIQLAKDFYLSGDYQEAVNRIEAGRTIASNATGLIYAWKLGGKK